MVVTVPEQLDAASLERFARDLEVREGAVVLEGGPSTFCLGLSLAGEPDASMIDAFVRCIMAIRCGPPVVAFVAGAARGGGVGLAAAADRVIAGPDATFALTEAWFGLLPGAILPLLAERIRPAELRWLAMSGRTLSAGRAHEVGLVDVLGDRDAVDACLAELRRACPEAVVDLKRSTAPIEAVRLGAASTLERFGRPGVRDRIARFLDGEAPWA
ncbi:MAG: enoyl-CoA hydratase/isomerase family protein [Alphaproteobacteria bacterium]|nr:enoyl-CoA hydratase/isomerase family protein [Alphaproteobacteria bacterium]